MRTSRRPATTWYSASTSGPGIACAAGLRAATGALVPRALEAGPLEAGPLVPWVLASGPLPHAYSAGWNTSWSSVMSSSCQTPRAPRVR